MPFFTLRRQRKESSSAASPDFEPNSAALAESVEVIRRRARHRLIGSAVLVLAAIGLFPVLFETQPRPVPADIAVEIPGRSVYKPLQLPAAASAAASTPHAAAAPVVAAASKPMPPPVAAPVLVPNRPAAEETPAPAAIKLEAKPVPPKVVPTPSSEAARARALLEGQAAPPVAKKPAASSVQKEAPANANTAEPGRTVVQVGAFADAGKAGEIRARLEQAGLRSYTQAIETNDGKRIRVRVGPFASRAEADKAAAKIRAMDLPAAILNQ